MHRHGSVSGTCVVRLMRFTYIVLSIGGEGGGGGGQFIDVSVSTFACLFMGTKLISSRGICVKIYIL